MNPRIRIFVLVLALALLAAPTQAFASWAQPFAATSICGAATAGAPAGTDAITVNPAWTTGPVNIALAGTGTNFEWKLDCGSVNPGVNGGTAVVNTNGTHTFTHRAQNGGLWSDWVDDTVQVDNSTPTDGTTVPPGWHAGPYSVTLGAADSVSPVHGEYKIDGAGSWTTGASAVITGTGTHTLDTRAVDSAGNATSPLSFTNIQVDQTVPVDTTNFTGAWQHNSAAVTLTATDTGQSGVTTIMWQLDGGVATPASPNDVLTISTQGVHSLITYAVDAVGNQSIPKTTIVRVDRNGPTDNTTVPADWVNTPSVDVSVTGDDGTGSGVATIEWELEDLTTHVTTTGNVAGPGPVTVTVSGEGQHELRTRFTDTLGLTSGWKNQLVKIDTVAPSDATNPSAGWQKGASVDVNVNGTDATSGIKGVEWKLDGVAGSDLASSHLVSVTGNGEFVVEHRVQDNAGNWSQWASHTVRLDTTAPSNLTPAADTDWRTSAYAVKLSGTDAPSGVARVEWRVDGGATHQGTNNLETATVSGNGTHTLETRIVDNAGNDSGWRAEPVNIDSLKPTATTTCPSSAVASGFQIALTGTDAGASGVSNHGEWSLDGGAERSGMTATILGGGPHTLKTRVQDNAGNWSDWLPCSVTVNPALPPVDSTPPIDYTSVPGPLWHLTATTVAVLADDGTGTGVEYVEWQVDDEDVQQGAPGATFTISSEGEHSVLTRATDYAGNSSDWKELTVNIDLTKPTDTTDYPAAFTKLTSIPLTATDATSGVDHIEYKLNNGTATTGTTVPLGADGTYKIETRVWDKAGKQTGWVAHTFVKDTVVPANSSGSVPSAWQTSAFSLPLSGSDAGSGVDHYEWKLGAGGTVQTGSPAVVSADGTQTLMTQVVDKAGNVSGWRSDTVKVDTTKPANTTPAVASGWRKTNFTTTVAGTDATSGVQKVEWRVDGGTPTSTPSVTISTTGSHLFETHVVDNAGNDSGWLPATIGIDKVVPTLSVSCGAIAWRPTPASCTVTASGGDSGLPTLTAQRGSAAATDISGGTYSVDADGRWTINFRAVDGAGNETTAHADVQIDRTAPTASVTCTAGAGVSYSCVASGSDANSGVSTLAYSVDGGGATPLGSGGSFTANKGNVVVFATDAAGNTGASAPLALADRTPPPKKTDTKTGSGSGSGSGSTSTVTPRTTSSAVMAKKGGSPSSRLLGQLAISSTPSKTTVDLRPLALGSGKFQFVFKLTVGKKTKTYTKTQTTKKGYSTRIAISTAAGASAKVSLTVKKRSGSHWVTHASGSAHLG